MSPDLAQHLRDLGLLDRPRVDQDRADHDRAVRTGISARDPWWQRGEDCPH